MPQKAKHKNANQHEKRHDTGLAPPGKRISKDKLPSGSSVNGSANGKPDNPVQPPRLPSSGLNQGLTFSHSAPQTDNIPPRASDDRVEIERAERKDSLPTDGPADEVITLDMGAAPAPMDRTSSESRCVGDGQTLRSLGSQASSTLAFAVTILRSCPLRDAVAILILLLSLPPTLIITVHALFSSLTLVTPSVASFNWSSWTSFHAFESWFHATQGGGPSPFTILLFDAITWSLYMMLPLNAQSFMLDFGQVVIAISLSGATADKGTSSNSVALCSAIIAILHLSRYKALHLTGMDYLRSFLQGLGLTIPGDSLASSRFISSTTTVHGWARMFLGCHILAQGILTLLRRSLAGVSRPQPTKKQDPEAASYSDAGKAPSGSTDANPETPPNSSTDGRHPGPSPAVRDKNERVSNSKKKRKQANQVRSQQPLWAAIASTKVTFLKEMEQKQASTDALEASSGDSSSSSGLATAILQQDRVWVADVYSTEVTFAADLSTATLIQKPNTDDKLPLSAGIDRLKPFYVRLNGADWGSTRIFPTAEDEETTRSKLWTVEIYGLTPMTKYSCEFVRLSDQQVLDSATVITLLAPNAEQTSATAAPSQQSLRPLSPTSTLKQSIAAAENKREEVRNRLKRYRKDHKNTASTVRREIEQLNSKVASSGGQDERLRQRILQLTQNVKQADDATAALKEETDGLGDIPEDEVAEANSRKQEWDSARDARAAALAELEQAKAEANKKISSLHAELASAGQKHDRQTARLTKLNEQFERLVSEQHADQSNRQRREQERAHTREERTRLEEQANYWVRHTRLEAENLNIRANEFFQEADLLNTQLQRQQASISRPPTPEGDLPGTNGPQSHQTNRGLSFSMFGMPQGHGSSAPAWGGRQRSSSMLSGYSGFTDDLDVPSTNGYEERKKSDDSSGSNGSYEDTTGRPSGQTRSPGPIGPPSSFGNDKGKGKAPMNTW